MKNEVARLRELESLATGKASYYLRGNPFKEIMLNLAD